MDPSPGVAVIQGQVEALTDLRRSVLISPMNSPELTGALNTLIAWAQPTFEASVRWQPQRRRGRVADHRLEWLVHQTMRRLEAIGVPLLCGRRGVLASVLRVLLRAADRLEQRAPAPRTNMWKDLQRWLATYRRESNSPASR
ncbi:MAG: hypothetical protein ABI665_16570 [Vicinamibacterales bacterium]